MSFLLFRKTLYKQLVLGWYCYDEVSYMCHYLTKWIHSVVLHSMITWTHCKFFLWFFSVYLRYSYDPYETMFGAERPLLAIYHNMTVTTKSYENKIVPDSHARIWLLLFYHDQCSPCLQAAPVWHRIQQVSWVLCKAAYFLTHIHT